MRRFSSRDLSLSLLLILVVFFTFSSLQQMNREDTPTYSEVLTYFRQERVAYFTLEDNTLTLSLRGEGDQTYRVTYRVARPDWLYQDLHQLWEEQYAAGILLGYDLPPGWRAPGGTTCSPIWWRWRCWPCSGS